MSFNDIKVGDKVLFKTHVYDIRRAFLVAYEVVNVSDTQFLVSGGIVFDKSDGARIINGSRTVNHAIEYRHDVDETVEYKESMERTRLFLESRKILSELSLIPGDIDIRRVHELLTELKKELT